MAVKSSSDSARQSHVRQISPVIDPGTVDSPAPPDASYYGWEGDAVEGETNAIGRAIAANRDWHIDTANPQKSVVFLSAPRVDGQLSPVSGDSRRGASYLGAFFALVGAIEAWRRKFLAAQRADGSTGAEPRSFAIMVQGTRCRVQRVQDTRFHVRVPAALMPLQKLGMPESLKNYALSPDLNTGGLVLVCGAYGCGKTTTVNAVVRERVARCGGYALMLGAPIEYEVSGHHGTDDVPGLIEQVDLVGLDVTSEIRASMRSFPSGATSILAYPELVGSDGAGEMLRAANRGSLVFGDMHARDLEAGILNLVSYANQDREVYARELLANSLRLVVHQTMSIRLDSPRGVLVKYDYLRVSRALRQALADTSTPLSKVLTQLVATEMNTASASPR